MHTIGVVQFRNKNDYVAHKFTLWSCTSRIQQTFNTLGNETIFTIFKKKNALKSLGWSLVTLFEYRLLQIPPAKPSNTTDIKTSICKLKIYYSMALCYGFETHTQCESDSKCICGRVSDPVPQWLKPLVATRTIFRVRVNLQFARNEKISCKSQLALFWEFFYWKRKHTRCENLTDFFSLMRKKSFLWFARTITWP